MPVTVDREQVTEYAVERRRFQEIRAARAHAGGQVSLHIGCDACIHAYVPRVGPVDCLCGWAELDASTCPDFDRTVHCLNGYVYGERRGCQGDCGECWAQLERRQR